MASGLPFDSAIAMAAARSGLGKPTSAASWRNSVRVMALLPGGVTMGELWPRASLPPAMSAKRTSSQSVESCRGTLDTHGLVERRGRGGARLAILREAVGGLEGFHRSGGVRAVLAVDHSGVKAQEEKRVLVPRDVGAVRLPRARSRVGLHRRGRAARLRG